jgi:hypothetical protein
MDFQLVNLILSKQFRAISPEALKVYLALRAEVLAPTTATTRLYLKAKERVAALPVQSIGGTCGFTDLAARRVLDELALKGWIQSKRIGRGDVVYLLGDFKNVYEPTWLIDKFQGDAPESTKVSGSHREDARDSGEDGETDSDDGVSTAVGDLMAQVKDNQAAIKESETRRNGRKKTNPNAASESRQVRVLAEIGLIEKPEEARRFIAAKWKEMHKEKFHCDPDGFRPSANTKAAMMIMNRKVTKWCLALWKLTGDLKDVEEYFAFTLENWQELRAKVFPDFNGVVPHLAYIVNTHVFRKIRGCMVAGIQEKVITQKKHDNMQDRAAKTDWDKEPTVGW